MDIHDVRAAQVRRLIDLRFEGSQAAFARAAEVSDTYVTRLLKEPGHKDRKRLGEKLARKIEDRLGLPTRALDQDVRVDRTVSGQSSHPSRGVAHAETPQPFHTPISLLWEGMLNLGELPETFTLAVPDDALAPDTPRGTVYIFYTGVEPTPGHAVLVQDKSGGRYLRRYVPGVGGHWTAEARHNAYPSLEAARDGLKLLAVAKYRNDGAA